MSSDWNNFTVKELTSTCKKHNLRCAGKKKAEIVKLLKSAKVKIPKSSSVRDSGKQTTKKTSTKASRKQSQKPTPKSSRKPATAKQSRKAEKQQKTPKTNLESLTVKQLLIKCKQRGINCSKLRKAQIIERLLREADPETQVDDSSLPEPIPKQHQSAGHNESLLNEWRKALGMVGQDKQQVLKVLNENHVDLNSGPEKMATLGRTYYEKWVHTMAILLKKKATDPVADVEREAERIDINLPKLFILPEKDRLDLIVSSSLHYYKYLLKWRSVLKYIMPDLSAVDTDIESALSKQNIPFTALYKSRDAKQIMLALQRKKNEFQRVYGTVPTEKELERAKVKMTLVLYALNEDPRNQTPQQMWSILHGTYGVTDLAWLQNMYVGDSVQIDPRFIQQLEQYKRDGVQSLPPYIRSLAEDNGLDWQNMSYAEVLSRLNLDLHLEIVNFVTKPIDYVAPTHKPDDASAAIQHLEKIMSDIQPTSSCVGVQDIDVFARIMEHQHFHPTICVNTESLRVKELPVANADARQWQIQSTPEQLKKFVEQCHGSEIMLCDLAREHLTGGRHANAMLINKKLKQVEIFDPNRQIDDNLVQVVKEILLQTHPYTKDYTVFDAYRADDMTCPRFGPQLLADADIQCKSGGFCAAYSQLYMNLRMLAPAATSFATISSLTSLSKGRLFNLIRKYIAWQEFMQYHTAKMT